MSRSRREWASVFVSPAGPISLFVARLGNRGGTCLLGLGRGLADTRCEIRPGRESGRTTLDARHPEARYNGMAPSPAGRPPEHRFMHTTTNPAWPSFRTSDHCTPTPQCPQTHVGPREFSRGGPVCRWRVAQANNFWAVERAFWGTPQKAPRLSHAVQSADAL
jgi:hypothetical protein